MEFLKYFLAKFSLLILKLFGRASDKTTSAPEIETTTQTDDTAVLGEAVLGKMILGNEG